MEKKEHGENLCDEDCKLEGVDELVDPSEVISKEHEDVPSEAYVDLSKNTEKGKEYVENNKAKYS